jgi:hypothetical protein
MHCHAAASGGTSRLSSPDICMGLSTFSCGAAGEIGAAAAAAAAEAVHFRNSNM